MIPTGQPAPLFTLPDAKGVSVSLGDFSGKKVVLYFYPKDDTPGCTIEARDFSRLKPEFDKRNAVVIGVSRDSLASHNEFACKYNLALTLLSDPDHTVIESYGAWREKNNYGKVSMGIVRSTYLIDENGKVAGSWDNVKAGGHAESVLNSIG
jgi:peroxiredoxin Q/BCP